MIGTFLRNRRAFFTKLAWSLAYLLLEELAECRVRREAHCSFGFSVPRRTNLGRERRADYESGDLLQQCELRMDHRRCYRLYRRNSAHP